MVVLAALSRYSLARNARLAAGVFILAVLCGCSGLLPQTAQLRENSLFKVDTLLGALHRFRDGLVAEAEFAEQREQRRR